MASATPLRWGLTSRPGWPGRPAKPSLSGGGALPDASRQDAQSNTGQVGQDVLRLERPLTQQALDSLERRGIGEEHDQRDDGARGRLSHHGNQGQRGVSDEMEDERERFAKVRYFDSGRAPRWEERRHGSEHCENERGHRPGGAPCRPGQGLRASRPGRVRSDEQAGVGELLAHPHGRGAAKGRTRRDRTLEGQDVADPWLEV